jgi:hypothetical protein
MRRLSLLIPLSLILGFLSFLSCSHEKDEEPLVVKQINIDTISFPHSMKGWDLYSWPNGNDWNYSILIGTNRLKTYHEVISNDLVVSGKDSLKLLLDKIPPGEEICWIGEHWLERVWGKDYGYLSLPDRTTIAEIEAYCNTKELILSICD